MIADINSSSKQQTIRSEFSFNGIGLHSGKEVLMRIEPAEPNNGIKFIRSDIKKNNIIDALWSNVSSTNLCTTITNKDNVSVSTIEHLMSALSGMHIDNANIYINNPEVPIMDGSSLPFVENIEKSGIVTQKINRKIIKVKKEILVHNNDSYAKIIPNEQFSIDFEIEFESTLINKQACQLQLINGNYKSDISSARTFGFEKDVDYLRANGLALGGSLDNAVVVGENNILNADGLRFDDEFVRHKILDSIGDLYLAGSPIQGYFYGNKSGHFLNNELLRKLFSDSSNFELI
ncbi:UDP-3-O-acyl-N-acetylglucosamine deacetylase [Alphaproteobacteria bacterium]|nr:UDP-3-O-acyl-N-acetylglucosamine deacetylase [Alphaproteobacteria bacterium]